MKKKLEPPNPTLAANMKRLMAGRSIGRLRAEMAQAGYAIGTETIQRAVHGEVGNRLASLEKIAAFFDATVEQLLQPAEERAPLVWPFSLELQGRVASLGQEDLDRCEDSIWAWLRVTKPSALTYPEPGEFAKGLIHEASKPPTPKRGDESSLKESK